MRVKIAVLIAFAGLFLFCPGAASADPQHTPAAPLKTPVKGANLSPEEMGQQFEKLLQGMIKTGNEVSKKAYGMDLEKEMGVAGTGQSGAAVATPGAAGDTAPEMFQGIFQNSTDLIGKSMGVLGKMAEMDLKQMQEEGKSNGAAPQTDNQRKAEDLAGRGTIKAMMGDTEGSIELFMQAITLNPEYGTAYYNLACALAKLGQVEKFSTPLNKAIAIDGKYRGMAQRDSDFDRVRNSRQFLDITASAAKP